MAWIDRGDLWFRSFKPNGGTSGGALRLNNNRGAVYGAAEEAGALVSNRKNLVVVTWLEFNLFGNASILAARSTDGGRTFSKPARVSHRKNNAYRKGQRSAIGAGRIYTAWIEGEDLYLSRSVDGGAKFERERIVIKKICDCCAPGLAVGASGRLYIAFRDNQDNVRNIKLVYSDDGGNTFSERIPVADGDWKIEGCPISGPSIAVDGEKVAVAWMDARDGQQRIYLAKSDTGGKSFGPNEVMSGAMDGMPNHPALAVTGDGALHLAWEELQNGAIYYREWDPVDGKWREAVDATVSPGKKSGKYAEKPKIAAMASGDIVLAWQSDAGSEWIVHHVLIDKGKITR